MKPIIRVNSRAFLVVCVFYSVLKNSIAEETEKGNVHILPAVTNPFIPDKSNSTSDGHNTTVPGKPQIFPIYDTSHLNNTSQNHDNYHHHGGQLGKEHNHTVHEHHGCHHNHTEAEKPQNRSCAHDHENEHSAEKVEQILWDIFTDEMEEESDEEVISDDSRLSSDENDQETEEVAHDETVDESNELNSNEEITVDSHVITKRSDPEHREARKKDPKKSGSKGKSKGASSSTKKYNEYMDVVLKRMNTMIKGKNMDPLMVNLFSGANKGSEKKKGSGGKNTTKGKKKKKGSSKGKNNRARMDTDESDEVELDNKHELSGVEFMRKDLEVDEREAEHDGHDEEDTQEEGVLFRNVRALILNGSMKRSNINGTEVSDDAHETRGFDSAETGKKSSNGSKSNKNSKKPGKGSNKPKSPGKKPKQQATRGILKGLSSLRRTGNVDVIRQGDKVRIVRSKFLLGPVMLEIVPKTHSRTPKAQESKGSSQNSRVTAVASQLKGIIEVRLKKHNPTTIKRLRVFPPSSVKVKSSPNSKTSSVPRYSKVTPVATHRLRQIASAVVRQADLAKAHAT